MEITAPAVSNVVCFRYKPRRLTEPELEKLNKMICSDLNRTSFWMVSDTTIKGRHTLRACNVNHRSQKQDLDFLVNEVKKTCERVVSEIYL